MSGAGRRETVLVIHDRDEDVEQIREWLGSSVVVRHARHLRDGRAVIDELHPDVVLVSLELAELPGPRVVRMLHEQHRVEHVVAMTRQPSTSDAVATIRAGGVDYLEVPVQRERLEQAVQRALRERRGQAALAETQAQMKDRYGFHHLLSRSPKMLEVFDEVRAVAPTDATVLVLGETGTGKELVARAIHDGSPRMGKSYVSVNCGAFTESLLESELFGHERGSFTGAVERREGVFSLADGGTLFLDELGETSLGLQVKLLRVLEEMSFRRVGGEKPVTVDVRIVAATHVDLEEAVIQKAFRDDLYYRLNVFPIHLPPLRERREDIPLLLRHFVEDAAREYGLKAPIIAADALLAIQAYRWPGNVRQLRAMCERWVILSHGRTLLREALPPEMRGGNAAMEPEAGPLAVDDALPLPPQLAAAQERLERSYFEGVLRRFKGHQQAAAEHAGITRRTLYTKIRQYGIDPDRYRGDDPSGGRA